eukprot:GHRR01033934.1.p3 GENE.GHRR01033934.1~~GHRR01033934.1.p3  ORF type:complete len:112 (-),score=28.80 GHRR01033934.1:741-1076(-)
MCHPGGIMLPGPVGYDLLLVQATLTGNPGSSFFWVALRMSPLVPAALTLLSLVPSPKGDRKIDATLLAQAVGSPDMAAGFPTAPSSSDFPAALLPQLPGVNDIDNLDVVKF